MNNMSSTPRYCDICKNVFKSYNSLWEHKKRMHKKKEETIKKGFKCQDCDKEFTLKNNMYRHRKSKCKVLKQKQEKQSKEQNMEQIEINSSPNASNIGRNAVVTIDSKTDASNSSDSHNTTTNSHNTTINNNYIIALGDENLSEVLTKDEKHEILKKRFSSLEALISFVHFNKKFPEFKNILITNWKNNLAKKYNMKSETFIDVKKEDLIDDIFDIRLEDIFNFWDELKDEVDEITNEKMEHMKFCVDNDEEWAENKKYDIKLLIYNKTKDI